MTIDMKSRRSRRCRLAEFPFLFWLGVHTDAGLVGTGETFWAPGPVGGYIHDNVAPYLIGKDPRDIELHDRTARQRLCRRARLRRRGARQLGGQYRALGHLRAGARRAGLAAPRRPHASAVPVYNTCAGLWARAGDQAPRASSSGPRTGR